MESYLRRLLGAVKVYEKDDLVHIEGISTAPIINAFYNIWKTSKIGDNIFTHTNHSSLSFNKFFVPDLVYSFSVMAEQKPRGVNVRVIQKTIELLKQNTWFIASTEPTLAILDRDKLKKFMFDPLEHQTEFFNDYEESTQKFHLKGYLLAAAPGSGKTMMSLFLGELLDSDVNIIIVPKNSIDLVWKKTFEEAYKKKTSYWVSSSDEEPPKHCRNYAFHYERLIDAIEFVKKNHFFKPMLWLDESHNLNEPTSERSQLFMKLVDVLHSNNVIYASGTPIKAMGREVIPLLRSIDPYFNDDAQQRFTDIFGKSTSRAVDILSHRVGMIIHLTTKAQFRQGEEPISKDVKVKIPNGDIYTLSKVKIVLKAFIAERIEFYQKHMKEYENTYNTSLSLFDKTIKTKELKHNFDIYKSYISIIRKGYDPVAHKEMAKFCNQFELKTIIQTLPQHIKEPFKNARTVIKYVLLKINGEALGRILGKMREQCIVDMVPHVNLQDFIDEADKKVLIFSTYVNAVKKAEHYLRGEGYQPLIVYGETNKNLTSIIQQFDKDEDANPLLATYASLSTAVPLIMANVCLMLNVPFRPYIFEQAISRVDRLGQDTQVYIYNFYLDTGEESNLSTRSGDILEFCRVEIEKIIGQPLTLDEDDVVTMECFPEFETFKSTIAFAPAVLEKW